MKPLEKLLGNYFPIRGRPDTEKSTTKDSFSFLQFDFTKDFSHSGGIFQIDWRGVGPLLYCF